MEAFKASKAQV